MKSVFLTLSLAVAFTGSAFGIACGNLAALTPTCTVTSGNTTFSLSNLNFTASSNSGGAFLYQAGDVSIALSSDSTGGASLQVTKNTSGPNPNSFFFVNPGIRRLLLLLRHLHCPHSREPSSSLTRSVPAASSSTVPTGPHSFKPQ